MKNLFISVILMVVLCGCGREQNNINGNLVHNPATAGDNKSTGKEPVLTFSVKEHDFGKLIQGEQVSYAFKFKNTGNAPLIITAVEKACGCTNTQYPKVPIEPGKEDKIVITYDSNGHKGFQNKRIVVKANTNPSESVIRIKAQVETVDTF